MTRNQANPPLLTFDLLRPRTAEVVHRTSDRRRCGRAAGFRTGVRARLGGVGRTPTIGGSLMDQIAPHRAHSLAEFGAMAGKIFAPDLMASSLAAYRPRPSDVIITPYGKCGTTWLQQIFHTLRTRGDFDFDDISRVVPWIETSATSGVDIEAPQRGEPRGFKSHLD